MSYQTKFTFESPTHEHNSSFVWSICAWNCDVWSFWLNWNISSLQLSVRLSVTSRRSCAMLHWTLRTRWPLLPPPPPWRRATSCQTVRSSPLATSVSAAPRPCSSLPSSVSYSTINPDKVSKLYNFILRLTLNKVSQFNVIITQMFLWNILRRHKQLLWMTTAIIKSRIYIFCILDSLILVSLVLSSISFNIPH